MSPIWFEGGAVRDGDGHRGLARTRVVGDRPEPLEEADGPIPDEVAAEDQDGGGDAGRPGSLCPCGRSPWPGSARPPGPASMSRVSSPRGSSSASPDGGARPEAILTPPAAFPGTFAARACSKIPTAAAANRSLARCFSGRRPASRSCRAAVTVLSRSSTNRTGSVAPSATSAAASSAAAVRIRAAAGPSPPDSERGSPTINSMRLVLARPGPDDPGTPPARPAPSPPG